MDERVKTAINEMADELDQFFRQGEPTLEEAMDKVRCLTERTNKSLAAIAEERKRQYDLFHKEEQLTIQGS